MPAWLPCLVVSQWRGDQPRSIRLVENLKVGAWTCNQPIKLTQHIRHNRLGFKSTKHNQLRE